MLPRRTDCASQPVLWCLVFVLLRTSICTNQLGTEIQLPCPNFGGQGCVPGAEHTGIVFSALQDPTLKQVSVFVDFNSRVIGEIKDAATHAQVTCTFWDTDTQGSPLHSSPGLHDYILDDDSIVHNYHPFIVRCPDPLKKLKRMPRFVGLEVNGIDIKARVPLEQVNLQGSGSVGACLAPIYTEQFDLLYEWLNHYTSLGVDGFHCYWTSAKVRWGKDEQRTETSTFKPFSHSLVTWMEYEHSTEKERYYFAQQTAFNDCVFRNRHRYEFLLMFDLDEFLIVRDERFSHGKHLSKLLRNIFPPTHAALGIYRWAYRSDCGIERDNFGDDVPLLRQYTHREPESESPRMLLTRHFGDKLIVRPLMVSVFYMHWLQAARPPFSAETFNAQPSIAFIKHLRSHGDDCSKLEVGDPYDQP